METDRRIADAAKTLFSYCRARTSTREEAEDLSQDILLELLRSRDSLRDDRAFYGFLWAVAGNVCKSWYKKRARGTAPLDENHPDEAPPIAALLEKEGDLQLLRRELALLGERHRRVTVLYYFEGLRVAGIAASLGVSEAMVKFLLFKSRQILREGMDMERTPGELSYNPRKMSLRFWGNGGNPFWKLCDGNLLAQNILLACYNDRCTAAEISLQIGVAVPYLEKDLKALCEHGMLTCRGGRYETNVVIFTKDFIEEADWKTQPLQREMAEAIQTCLREKLDAVKAVGFRRGVEDGNLLRWHIAAILLEKAVFHKYQDSLDITYPTKYSGCEAFVWGEEDYTSRYTEFGGFGTTACRNAQGDLIRFLDYACNGPMDHFYFFNRPDRVNVILDIANGKTEFSENDKNEIAELIKLGYAEKAGGKLSLRLPVFTKEQFDALLDLLDGAMDEIAEKTREAIEISTGVLEQHTPTAMQKQAQAIGWLNMFNTSVCAPVRMLLDDGTLRKAAQGEHPTAYVVLQ
ncbi:MAG: RNA polymerase sigma factor [Firmicutes bacterium]|nr:RNA polymerase sigma factor [Bacillota bacterium]